MCRTLCRLQDQLQRNKCIKHRLEENWSDKNRSLRIDAANLGLNIQSPLIMSHGDVVDDDPEKYDRPPQTVRKRRRPLTFHVCFSTTLLSVPEWEAAANGLKNKADGVLNDSALLRSAIDDMLEQNAKRLRCQADAVDIALARFISDTRQVGNRIEVDLEQVIVFANFFFFFLSIQCVFITKVLFRKFNVCCGHIRDFRVLSLLRI